MQNITGVISLLEILSCYIERVLNGYMETYDGGGWDNNGMGFMAHSYSVLYLGNREREQGKTGKKKRKKKSILMNRNTKNLLLPLLPETDLVYYETDFRLYPKKNFLHKHLYKQNFTHTNTNICEEMNIKRRKTWPGVSLSEVSQLFMNYFSYCLPCFNLNLKPNWSQPLRENIKIFISVRLQQSHVSLLNNRSFTVLLAELCSPLLDSKYCILIKDVTF